MQPILNRYILSSRPNGKQLAVVVSAIANEFKAICTRRGRLQNGTLQNLAFSSVSVKPKMSGRPLKNGEKIFKPDFKGSPKHQFAKEYIEKHGPVTQTIMKELWTSLPSEERQIYKIRARQAANQRRRAENRKHKKRGQVWVAPGS
ncbi:hypothetical protein Moror_11861 [Moniliophthora roreri MCA 2997]|uniref:Uncharacterized protein n=1 Tax=Moniliophthora roreri (strain MCA 2997) TaxID=1381753 RepID=V2WK26_MONRO|nr:hypothetical protein Moror_11861 [Moniliophthora roreri MCA 2997]KAI3608061.1 hypothetical protein WG66_004507 [Moniliophthora roreri]